MGFCFFRVRVASAFVKGRSPLEKLTICLRGGDAEASEALVCKTSLSGFESRRYLQTFFIRESTLEPSQLFIPESKEKVSSRIPAPLAG